MTTSITTDQRKRLEHFTPKVVVSSYSPGTGPSQKVVMFERIIAETRVPIEEYLHNSHDDGWKDAIRIFLTEQLVKAMLPRLEFTTISDTDGTQRIIASTYVQMKE